MLYLKITKGMMYNAQISFILVRKSTGRRFLKDTVTGTGKQSDVAQGSYSENSTMKDYLAKFDCEAEDDETDSSYYLSYLQLDQTNGEVINAPITSKKLSTKDISQCKNDDAIKQYDRKEGVYVFAKRSTSLSSNERRLSSNSEKCLLSGNQGSFSLIGDIDIKDDPITNKVYSVATSADKELNCTLNKEKATTEASLDCIMDGPARGFYISEEVADETNGGRGLSFDSNTTETLLCQTFYSESGESVPSSGGGLSGGAIAGIVISCIVIVAAIGAVLYFINPGKAAAILNEVSPDISNKGDNSNYALPNDNTISKMPVSN